MQDSLLCGETHGVAAMNGQYWGQSPHLQDTTMKTLATDRALVTAWLLAQGGLQMPAQQASPAPAAPTQAPPAHS